MNPLPLVGSHASNPCDLETSPTGCLAIISLEPSTLWLLSVPFTEGAGSTRTGLYNTLQVGCEREEFVVR